MVALVKIVVIVIHALITVYGDWCVRVCVFPFSYATSVGGVYVETSAKQNKGIEELFLDMCKRT